MIGSQFHVIWDFYFEQTFARCKRFLQLPMEVNQTIAEFLPWSFLFRAISNPGVPWHLRKKNRLECNTSYLMDFLKKNPWWIDGLTPDHQLWEHLWNRPLARNDLIVIEFKVHRIEHVEKRLTSVWNNFEGTIRLHNIGLVYEKPSFYSLRTLDVLIGSIYGRDEEILPWGYKNN